MDIDIISIECSECSKQWRLEIPLTGHEVESFATLCECGAIIVGNRKKSIAPDLELETELKERYLTNGSYNILSNDKSVAIKSPLLELE